MEPPAVAVVCKRDDFFSCFRVYLCTKTMWSYLLLFLYIMKVIFSHPPLALL